MKKGHYIYILTFIIDFYFFVQWNNLGVFLQKGKDPIRVALTTIICLLTMVVVAVGHILNIKDTKKDRDI